MPEPTVEDSQPETELTVTFKDDPYSTGESDDRIEFVTNKFLNEKT